MDTTFFSYMEIVIGLFLLISAIAGKGPAYKSDNIRKECIPDYNKAVRIFCLVLGVLWTAVGVMDYMKMYEMFVLILTGVTFALIVVFVIITRKYTDRTKAK